MLHHQFFSITCLLASCTSSSSLGAIVAPKSNTTAEVRKNLLVDLGYAKYEGHHNDTFDINIWRGIRYAKAAIGDLRWQLPQAPDDNLTTIQATSNPPACPQSPSGPIPPNYTFSSDMLGEEDCLFLNVFAPSNRQNLPVLVWIHGGGYGLGSASAYDLSYMDQTVGNEFVSVIIQYRLGAFGFLSSSDVAHHGALNAGLHDQRFALEWIQKHIHKFGGNPDEVTISGESAGGASVMLAAMAYGGADGTRLWKRGISSSPFHPPQWEYSDFIPSQSYYKFAEAGGCFSGSVLQNGSVFGCLQSRDTVTLQNASRIASQLGTYGGWAFLPVTDGGFIPDRPSTYLTAGGKLNGLRVLIGNNANEGTFYSPGNLTFPARPPLTYKNFVPQNITTQQEFTAFLTQYYPLLSSQNVSSILALYSPDPAINRTTPLFDSSGITPPFSTSISGYAYGWQQAANNLYAESTFICPAYWLADAFSNSHHPSNDSRLPSRAAWRYQYSPPNAFHGTDLGALMNDPQSQSTSLLDSTFRLGFQKVWGRFVLTGDPTLPADQHEQSDLPSTNQGSWYRWGQDGQHPLLIMNISGHAPYIPNWTVVDGDVFEGSRRERCNMWANMGKQAMV